MKRVLIFIFIILLFSNFINAITCSETSFNVELNENESFTTPTFSCENPSNESVTVSKLGSFFTMSESTPFIMGAGSTRGSLTLSFPSQLPGVYLGYIYFSDGSDPLEVSLVVNEEEQIPQGCVIDVFPTVMTNVKVVQGEKKTRNIQFSVPLCFESPVSVNGVTLQTDEKPIQLGEVSIGTVQPGNSVMIPIDINAEGVSTGQYSDTLQFLVYDNLGNKINVQGVSISVLVTQGIQALNNFSLSDLPTCSLDDIDLAVNQTYRLTCSITNPNINIHPLIESKYLRGVGVSETSSQYIYSFKPLFIGETYVGAEFWYKNAPLGSPYMQDVRISPSGSTEGGGIYLKFNFYQEESKKDISELTPGDTNVLITDNSTGNIINDFKLYVNGAISNNTLFLEVDKNYELRVSSFGYLDKVINFTMNQTEVEATLIPDQEEYFVGDTINVSTKANSSFLLNNNIITMPYTFTSPGNKTLKIVNKAYSPKEINLTIRENVIMVSSSPLVDDWKKGKKITAQLSTNVSWEVYHNDILVSSGVGTLVEFKINDFGKWEIKSGSKGIILKQIEKVGWLTWDSIKLNWFYWVIGVFVVILILVFLFRDKEKEDEGGFSFSPPIQND